MKLKNTPLVLLALPFLALGCAGVASQPQDPCTPAQEADADLQAMADAAMLLVERGKLMPLADGLRSLGQEPDPAEAAATIDRVLRSQ